MVDWRTYLASLGIDDANTVAGFAGSVVNALRLQSPQAIKVLSTIISGTLIAIYLGRLISKLIGIVQQEYVIAISFIVGFLGYSALDRVIMLIQSKLGTGNGSTPGGPKDADTK